MEFHWINMMYAALTMRREDDIFMQRQPYIDEAHTVLDIFRQRFQDSALPYTAIAGIFYKPSSCLSVKFSHHILSTTSQYEFGLLVPQNVKITLGTTNKFECSQFHKHTLPGVHPPTIANTQGACKYYISTLGGVGGLKEMLISLMWMHGGGRSRGKMLILLM